MSSSSPRPYKSHLLNFINRQSMQWRDRVGQAVRHLRVAAEWSVQSLVFPLFWFIQNGRMAGNPLGTGTRDEQLPLGAAATTEEDAAIALYDRPLDRILVTLEPWLAENASLIDPLPPDQAPARTFNSPWGKLWEKVQTINPWAASSSPQLLPVAPETSADSHLTRSQFYPITQAPTFAEDENNTQWWVRGIATNLASRHLVLVTTENQTLDLLTEAQQKRLQKKIRLEMANYGYERRRQLAPQQKILGLIPAVSPQSGELRLPVDLLWQSVRWLETQELAIAAGQWTTSTLVPAVVTALPHKIEALTQQTTQHWRISAHLAQSDRPVAALPSVSLAPGRMDKSSIPQTFPLTDLLRAAIHHFFGSTAQTTLPPSPESLAAASIQQSLPLPGSVMVLQQQLVPLSALSPARLLFPVKALQGSVETNPGSTQANIISPSPADPFAIQHILRAAIEDFLKPQAIAIPPQERSVQSLITAKLRSLLQKLNPAQSSIVVPSQQEQALEDPWLMWEDLFPEPFASSPITSVSGSGAVVLPPLPSAMPIPSLEQLTDAFPKNVKRSQSAKALQKKTKKSKQLIKTKSASNNPLSNSEPRVNPLATATNFSATESQSAIDFDPDWIEIGAESVGYVKHPLEIILEILDWLILGLEKVIFWIWQYIKKLIPSA